MNENNSPSDETNQEEPKESDKTLTDTLPPSHGWLEQFEAFKAEAFAELEAVAGQGLHRFEAEVLGNLAIRLIKVADAQYAGFAKEVAEELLKL